MNKPLEYLKNQGLSILNQGITMPVNSMISTELETIVTSIGRFVIRKIKDKFQRCISFQIGLSYGDKWMEDALYAILYKWNDIKNSRDLILSIDKDDATYYRLKDGTHNLKYRDYDIILYIETESVKAANRARPIIIRNYSVITYNLNEQFVKDFESDMIKNRNSFLKLNPNSPFTNVYRDDYDGGYVYWWKSETIPKRRLNTIFIPNEQKVKLVTCINRFFERKKFYDENGIPHNLKILLHGPAGSGLSILATNFINS